MDDIFMIWTHGEEHLKTFIGYLNSIHPSIKFTHEYSNSLHQTLPFLDVQVHLINNDIQTDLYTKSMHRQTSIPPKNIVPPKPHQKSYPIRPLPSNLLDMFYRDFL